MCDPSLGSHTLTPVLREQFTYLCGCDLDSDAMSQLVTILRTPRA